MDGGKHFQQTRGGRLATASCLRACIYAPANAPVERHPQQPRDDLWLCGRKAHQVTAEPCNRALVQRSARRIERRRAHQTPLGRPLGVRLKRERQHAAQNSVCTRGRQSGPMIHSTQYHSACFGSARAAPAEARPRRRGPGPRRRARALPATVSAARSGRGARATEPIINVPLDTCALVWARLYADAGVNRAAHAMIAPAARRSGRS